MNNENNNDVENNVVNNPIVNPLLNPNVNNNADVPNAEMSNAEVPNAEVPNADVSNVAEPTVEPIIENNIDSTNSKPAIDDILNNLSEPNNVESSNTEFDNSFLPGLNDDMNNSVLPGFEGETFNTNEEQPFNLNPVEDTFDPNANNQDQFNMNTADPNFNQSGFDMNNEEQFSNVDPNLNQTQFDMNNQAQFNNVDSNFNQAQFNSVDPNFNQTQFDMNNQAFGQVQYGNDYSDGFAQNWMKALYQKANSKKFNWCAALFGPAYLFYRKMYLTGTLAFLIVAIINIILALLNVNSLITVIISTLMYILYFVGLGLGFYPLYKSFVQKQLEKYKKQVPDNNQLLNIASQKGGTSVAGLIAYIVVSLLINSAVTAMSLDFSNMGSATNTASNTTNEIQQTVLEDTFNFADNYYIIYDANAWFLDEDNSSLTKGNYELSYKMTYPASALGVNLSSPDGRASVLKLLVDSLTEQATQSNLQIENTNNSFISQTNCYYTYIDILDNVSASRYYFIILPEDEVLFQFVLEVDDTAIEYETHMEVISMLTQIEKDEDYSENNSANTTVNEINNTTESNEVSNQVQNTLSNEVNSTATNSVVENSTVQNSTASNATSNNTVTPSQNIVQSSAGNA